VPSPGERGRTGRGDAVPDEAPGSRLGSSAEAAPPPEQVAGALRLRIGFGTPSVPRRKCHSLGTRWRLIS